MFFYIVVSVEKKPCHIFNVKLSENLLRVSVGKMKEISVGHLFFSGVSVSPHYTFRGDNDSTNFYRHMQLLPASNCGRPIREYSVLTSPALPYRIGMQKIFITVRIFTGGRYGIPPQIFSHDRRVQRISSVRNRIPMAWPKGVFAGGCSSGSSDARKEAAERGDRRSAPLH
jgi:hypothetical protein